MRLKAICFLIYFMSSIVVSQNLEEQIYQATESFIADQNETTFQDLRRQENIFQDKANTADEHLALVYLECNKAYYLKNDNQSKAAISSYENAWKRFNTHQLSKISNYDIIEFCLKPLGNLYTQTNNYTNAENSIQEYIKIAKRHKDKRQYIAGIINLAALHQTRGMHNSVLQLIAEVENLSDMERSQREKLIRLKNFSTLALKNIKTTDIKSPPKLFHSDHTFAAHRMAYLTALKNKDYQEAQEYFNLAKQDQNEDSLSIRQLAKSEVEEAQLYYLLNDFDQADHSLKSALDLLIPHQNNKTIPKKSRLYPENTFIDIFDLRARLQSTSEDALAYYDLSFYVADLLNASLTSQESRLTLLATNRKRSEWCIALLFEHYEENQSTELFWRALQYAENEKASLLKNISQKKTRLAEHPNDSLLIREQILLKKQERLTDRYIKSQLGYIKSKTDDFNTQLLEVGMALKSLTEVIDVKYGVQNHNTIDGTKLQAQLNQDQATLITYFYGSDALYQFIISSEEYQLSKIDLSLPVRQKIRNFISLFDDVAAINNNIQAYADQAFELYKVLNLPKVEEQSNMIIIPDGLLNFLPFEALLTKPTSTTNFAKMPFLVSSFPIVYNTNISFYMDPQPKKNKVNILGMFPVFEKSSQPLTYSLEEAEAIQNLSNAEVFLKAEATKAAFINAAPQYDVLHLSTHATGGDFTHPASISFYDQPMLVNELYSLDLQPDLVVLSACETGIGKLQKGEGAMSIARGFQYAGSKNILFSLWQINDASTAALMGLFYKSYKTSNAAYFANRQSKLDYLNETAISNTKKSPYYWSAFVYYGQIDPVQTSDHRFYFSIGIIALIIVVFLWFRKRTTHD